MKKVSHKEYSKALRQIQKRIYELTDDSINIYDKGGHLDNPEVDLGVNWCCLGTVSADEATAFAAALTEAARLAKEFPYNGYQIEY